MSHAILLVVEAARQCQDAIETWKTSHGTENAILERTELMCEEIEHYAEQWPLTRLNRWLGFVLGVLAAHDILSRQEQSAMMRDLLVQYPERRDQDLSDHRDPHIPFHLDLGGSE